MPSTEPSVRWLSADEQRSWRSWLAAQLLLREALDREMKSDHAISLADYEILVRLSESPGHRMRMSDLADRVLSSRSRLSHQVARLESEGLLRRESCEDDRRGTLCTMTDDGWNLLVRAAPSHVNSVRRHLVDVLSEEEFAAVGSSCAKVVTAMQVDPGQRETEPDGVLSPPA